MEISELRMMIAMRLHAAVFGYMAFTPTIMLSYHPKCLGWVEMIGHPRAFAFDSIEFDIKKMRACIEDIMNGCCFTPDLPFHEAEQLALKNWVWTNERA
jgi:polysaccharide pyruvyl transferase WcaK-like protein